MGDGYVVRLGELVGTADILVSVHDAVRPNV
jgi:hypothetical protein